MFSKSLKRCEQCGHVVARKKFLNQTFFLSEDQRLIGLVGEKGRVQGCLNCLHILEAEEAGHIEKAEFEHRTIYTLRPNFTEIVKSRIVDFFTPKPKSKGQTNEQPQ